MSRLEFVDALPDPHFRNGRDSSAMYADVAAALRAHPWRWARLDHGLATPAAILASNINRGAYAAMTDGFEACCRGGDLYVRFTGKEARHRAG